MFSGVTISTRESSGALMSDMRRLVASVGSLSGQQTQLFATLPAAARSCGEMVSEDTGVDGQRYSKVGQTG